MRYNGRWKLDVYLVEPALERRRCFAAKEEAVNRVLSACLLCYLIVSPGLAEDPVDFSDPNLKDAVETELWVTDPTPTDMLGLTFLNAANRGIGSLTGLEYAVNLQTLYVRWNELSSLSALSGLTNLTYLDAHGNHTISSIAPLSGLTQLETLVIRINEITSLSAVSGDRKSTRLNSSHT